MRTIICRRALSNYYLQKASAPTLDIWNSSPNLLVESEELLYPAESLVAEFGGTLGLFLGFSFMGLWDGVTLVANFIKKVKCKQAQDHPVED